MSHPTHHQRFNPVNPQPPLKQPATKPKGQWFFSSNQWAMFIHLAQFTHCIAPLGGIVAPILIWQLKKDELPGIDEHGKNVVNWIVSQFLYSIVAGILTFFLIGIPLLIGLFIISILFPIVGAIKANDGKAWRYPLTIRFFK